MSRAFIFTLDAALALIPVFIILGAVTMLGAGEMISIQAHTLDLNQRAEDALAVLEKQGTLDELARIFANYSELRSNNNPAWQTEYSRLINLTNSSLIHLIPERYGFALEFWGKYPDGTEYIDQVFTTDNRALTGQARPYENESTTIGMASKLLTGYEKEVPVTGGVARAWLSKIQWRDNIYFFGWQRTSSADRCGGFFGSTSCNNILATTMPFILPSDFNTTNCNSAYAELLTRVPSQYFDVNINGVTVYTNAQGYLLLNNICSYLNAGNNTITMSIRNSGSNYYELGTGSGTKVVVNARSNQSTPLVVSRFYINNVTSSCVVRQQMSLFTPGTIKSMKVHLELNGVDSVTLALASYATGGDVIALLNRTGLNRQPSIVEFTDTEIRAALLSHGLSYSDLSPRVYNLIIYLDTDESYENFDAISNPPSCGTQVQRTLTNSYIAVDWTPSVDLPAYYIDVTKSLSLQGSGSSLSGYYTTMTGSYYLPNGTTPWGVDVWIAWILRGTWCGTQDFSEDGVTLYSAPPFDKYLVRYAYIQQTGIMTQGEQNVFKAQGCSGGGDFYGFNPDRSYGTVTYLIYPYVPFGKTYPYIGEGFDIRIYYDGDQDGVYNAGDPDDGYQVISVGGGGSEITFCDLDPENYALHDALLRLMDRLNFVNDTNPDGYGTDCNYFDGSQQNPVDVVIYPDVKVDVGSIGGLTYMWGPIKARLRVWG